MGWSSQYFTTIIIEGNTPQTGIFIYAGTPGPNTLIGAWAAAAGTDAFGNPYDAGINVTQGELTGVSINQSTATVLSILSSVFTSGTINASQINQGEILETTIIFDSGGGMMFGYTSTTTTTTYATGGSNIFTSPINGTAVVTCIASGAGGDGGNTSEGGNGGGAGECAQEPNYPLVNGQNYTAVTGSGGGSSSTNGGHGGDGQQSTFDSNGVSGGVIANPGLGNGTGGTGSTNSVHFNGGSGGATSGFGGGASGANSGNTTAAGNNGLQSSSNTHAGAPVAQAGSGHGGAGGDAGSSASNATGPGGGGGGAGQGSGGITQKSISYAPVWNASYYGPDATNGDPNGTRTDDPIYQGGETASGGSANGNQRNVFGFNRTLIASDFNGYTITGAQVQFANLHCWYSTGMYIELDEFQGLPGTPPGGYPSGDFVSADATLFIDEGATTVFNISTSIAQRFVTGASNGLGMGHNIATSHPYDLYNYGYFDTSQTRFKITGTIGGSPVNSGAGADGSVVITYATSKVMEFALAPQSGSDSNNNAYAAGYTGPVNVFDPNASPNAVEVWHPLTLTNGWTKQGFARYKLIGYNMMLMEFQINDSSATSGAFCVMPTGYTATTGQFPALTIFNNAAGAPKQSVALCQVSTGAGGAITVLDWAKQSLQYAGNIFISLD